MTPKFPSKDLRQAAIALFGCAVLEVFPEAILHQGHVTEVGFTYDIALAQPIDEHVLILIEERMRAIVKEDLPIRWMEMLRDNAAQLFRHHHQEKKAEQAVEGSEKLVNLVQIGRYFDLMPPLPDQSTGSFPVVKLLKVTKAGDHLVRVHGTAAENKQALKGLLKSLDAYKKSHHVQLGQEMRLFLVDAPDQCLWLPKGVRLRKILTDYSHKELNNQGFEFLCSLNKEVLSHHVRIFFEEVAYKEQDIYKFAERQDIAHDHPLVQELSLLNAQNQSHELANIFCSFGELPAIVISSLQFMEKTFKIIGFKYQWYLRLPTKKGGRPSENWSKAATIMEQGLKQCGLDFLVDDEGFSSEGPKAEIVIIDSLGREWSGPYLSLNFQTMEQMLKKYRPNLRQPYYMVSRSIFGSIERLIALLLENSSGHLPLWLMPEHVRVISVSEKKSDYVVEVYDAIKKLGFRVGLDTSQDKLSGKVHSAEKEKIPYLVLIGEKEEVKRAVSIRSCRQEGINSTKKLEEWLAHLAYVRDTQMILI